MVCCYLKLLAEPFSPVFWQGASRTAPEASQVKQDAAALAAAEQMLAACGGAAVPTDAEQKQAIITCRRMLLELASIKVNLTCTPSCLVLRYPSKLGWWLCNLCCTAVVELASIKVNLPYMPSCLVLFYLSKRCCLSCDLRRTADVHLSTSRRPQLCQSLRPSGKVYTSTDAFVDIRSNQQSDSSWPTASQCSKAIP